MDIEKLPDKAFLSCVDIVYFPVFVAWIKSNAREDDSDVNVITQVRFIALLIHLAFKLYKLDLELHTKSLLQPSNRHPEYEVEMNPR